MAIQLLRLSALLSVLLQLGCASGGAHVKTVYEFPPKLDTLPCDSNGNCKVVVYVRVTASDKCEAMAEYATVKVMAGKTPKMRWDIEPREPGHVYDYRFAFEPTSHPPVYGIEIVNNTPLDFDAPGYERTFFGKDDKTKFKWDNKHGRSLPHDPFSYNLHVQRSPHNQEVWSDCTPIDPKIIND